MTRTDASIHRSTGASRRHCSYRNQELCTNDTAFFANLNGLGARAEVVSKTPRYVTLG